MEESFRYVLEVSFLSLEGESGFPDMKKGHPSSFFGKRMVISSKIEDYWISTKSSLSSFWVSFGTLTKRTPFSILAEMSFVFMPSPT